MRYTEKYNKILARVQDQPEGSILIFGDDEIDSVMIKYHDGWTHLRVGFHMSVTYDDGSVAGWLIGDAVAWSFS